MGVDRILLLGVSAIFAATPVVALAQDAPEDGAAAALFRQHFDPGVALFNAQRYQEALAEFAAAKQVEPAAEVDLWMGRCYDRLRDYARAVSSYSSYLAAVPDAPNAAKLRARIH